MNADVFSGKREQIHTAREYPWAIVIGALCLGLALGFLIRWMNGWRTRT